MNYGRIWKEEWCGVEWSEVDEDSKGRRKEVCIHNVCQDMGRHRDT